MREVTPPGLPSLSRQVDRGVVRMRRGSRGCFLGRVANSGIVSLVALLFALQVPPSQADEILPLPGPSDIGEGESVRIGVGSLQSGQSINVLPGGVLEFYSRGDRGAEVIGGGDPPAENIEINVLGGEFHVNPRWDLRLQQGVTFNLDAGAVLASFSRTMFVADGGVANINGGHATIGAMSGGVLNVNGGHVELDVRRGSTTTIRGGAIGVYEGDSSHAATLVGAEWRLNGQPVEEITTIGDTHVLRPSAGDVLSGVLADGTPVLFSNARGDNYGYDLRLELAETAPIGPSLINVSDTPGRIAARSGQTVQVGAGASLEEDYRAQSGSTTRVALGGRLGRAEIYGGRVEVVGGVLDNPNLFGGELHMQSGSGEVTLSDGVVATITGGELDLRTEADVGGGPTITMTGGTVDGRFLNGGVLNVSGGVLEGATRGGGQTVNLSGRGVVASGFNVRSGSGLSATGGRIDGTVRVDGGLRLAGGVVDTVLAEGTVTIRGSGLLYNAHPIVGLDNPGDTISRSISLGDVGRSLTGYLEDGTPFAFTGRDFTAFNSVRLELVEPAAIGGPDLTVVDEQGPYFALQGQTVTVESGGSLPGAFTASAGSTLEVKTGGAAKRVDTDGATLRVSGGEVDRRLTALNGSLVEVTGGSVGNDAGIWSGSTLRISGGVVGGGVTVQGGSIVELNGGAIGSVELLDTSTIRVAGGRFGEITAGADTQIELLGGRMVEPFDNHSASQARVHGGRFFLDGVPINQLGLGTSASSGDELEVTLSRGQLLTGEFADGTPFSHSPLTSSDSFTLVYSPAAEPTPKQFVAFGGQAPLGVRAGQTLVVDADASVESPIAGPGGRIEVNPGAVVRGVLESINGTVRTSGGEIESLRLRGGSLMAIGAGSLDDIEASRGTQIVVAGETAIRSADLDGSSITLSGAGIRLETLRLDGSTADIRGGSIRLISSVRDGSTLNISGGVVEQRVDLDDSYAHLSGGSLLDDVVTERSTFRVSGGVAFETVSLSDASTFELAGGVIESSVNLTGGSNALLTGGELRRLLRATESDVVVDAPSGKYQSLHLQEGSTLNYLDGHTDQVESDEAASVVFRGGTVGHYDADARVSTVRGGVIERIELSRFASSDQQLNVFAGHVGELTVEGSNEVRISGGRVEDLSLDAEATLSLSGGAVGESASIRGALSMVGGSIDHRAQVRGPLSMQGGRMGRGVRLPADGELFGIDFEIDGVPIPDGASVTITLEEGQLLTGVLADGTPIALGGERFIAGNRSSSGYERNGDHVTQLQLTRRFLQPTPDLVTVTPGSAPTGARPGQTVVFGAGTAAADHFRAGVGSSVVAGEGAHLGDSFEAFSADVTIDGATLGRNALIHDDAALQMTTGRVGESLHVTDGARVDLRGGTFGDGIITGETGLVVLSGEAFALDGVELEGLEVDSTYYVGELSHQRLSGVLQDGTPFLLHGGAYRFDGIPLVDDFTDGNGRSLAIHITPAAPVGPPLVIASSDPMPYGVRAGQTLRADAGSVVPDDFNAGVGSRVEVMAGATVGKNLEAVGAEVHVAGGVVGERFEAVDGAHVTLTGGSVGDSAFIGYGSRIVIDGGSLGDDPLIYAAESVELHGGAVGGDASIQETKSFVMTGGSLGDGFSLTADQVRISGGALGFGSIYNRSEDAGPVVITGGAFNNVVIDTQPVRISGGDFGGRSGIEAVGEITGGRFGAETRVTSRSDDELVVRGGDFSPGAQVYARVVGGRFEGATISGTIEGGEFDEVRLGHAIVTGGDFVGTTSSDGSQSPHIEGGYFERLATRGAHVYGGVFDSIWLAPDDGLDLYGVEFYLDGAPLDAPRGYEGLRIDQRGGLLTGVLADGSEISIELNDFAGGGDYVAADAGLRVHRTNFLGDYNDDGVVDAADYAVWRDTDDDDDVPGYLVADGDGDGRVDYDDYELWRRHFGRDYRALAPAAPEPHGLAIMLIGLLAARAVSNRN